MLQRVRFWADWPIEFSRLEIAVLSRGIRQNMLDEPMCPACIRPGGFATLTSSGVCGNGGLGTKCFKTLVMNVDGPGFSVSGDPDKIHAELSTDHVLWLSKQSVLIDKTELLKCAVIEWSIRHPVAWFRGTRLEDAVRSAWASSSIDIKTSSSNRLNAPV